MTGNNNTADIRPAPERLDKAICQPIQENKRRKNGRNERGKKKADECCPNTNEEACREESCVPEDSSIVKSDQLKSPKESRSNANEKSSNPESSVHEGTVRQEHNNLQNESFPIKGIDDLEHAIAYVATLQQKGLLPKEQRFKIFRQDQLPKVDLPTRQLISQNPQNVLYFLGSGDRLYGDTDPKREKVYWAEERTCVCPSVFIRGKWYHQYKAKKIRCPAPNCVLKRYLKTAGTKQSPPYVATGSEYMYPSKGVGGEKAFISLFDIMPGYDAPLEQPLTFDPNAVGPHPGFIEPCRAYLFEYDVQQSLKNLKTEHKDEAWRMQGVRFLHDVKRNMGL
jgi:hypothetical protein